MMLAEILRLPVEELLPHAGSMVLIDRALEYSDESLVAEVTITRQSQFFESGGVPCWVGVEYMAQTISAYAGITAKLNDEPVKIGFLLGTRKYEASSYYFPEGDTLTVKVQQICQDGRGLSVFRCSITGETISVQADINVFQPDNVENFLSGAA